MINCLKAMVERSGTAILYDFYNECLLKEVMKMETKASLNIEQTFHYNSRGNFIVVQPLWLLAGEINQ